MTKKDTEGISVHVKKNSNKGEDLSDTNGGYDISAMMVEVNYSYVNTTSTMCLDVYPMSQLQNYGLWYAYYHGYVSLVVCIYGIICNIFNILVLTRHNMWTPTNCILTGLAFSDLCTMVSYVPFALQFYVLHGLQPKPQRNTYPWVVFFLFHVNFSVTTHTISTWLGVLLSVFRYSYIRLSMEGRTRCSLDKAKLAVLLIYCWSIVILIPNYLYVQLTNYTLPGFNDTLYDLTVIDKNSTLGYAITTVNFWIHAVVIKLIPCGMMSVFGFLLVYTMKHTQKRSKRLRRQSTMGHLRKERSREHSRTTRMLVVVITLFLITELPQGILALLCGLIEGFFESVYVPLGDVMDIMALINNAINFTLYCSMSKKFRDTFIHLFCLKSVLSSKSRYVNANGASTILADHNVSIPTR